MKRSDIKTGLWCVVESLIPAIFCYLGQSNNALNFLQQKNIIGTGVDIELAKDIFSWLSIISTFALLTLPLAVARNRANNALNERDQLIRFWKDVLIKTLEASLGVKNLQINIRIFTPKHTIVTWLGRLLKRKYKLYFKIHNHAFLAEKDITEGLELMVLPEPEGLVGECYREKQMRMDNKLEETNETNYNLKAAQKQKTRNLKFSIVCPVFNDNGSDEVVAIVAFDCNQKILFTEKDKQKKLEDSVLNFTQLLSSNVPELFR